MMSRVGAGIGFIVASAMAAACTSDAPTAAGPGDASVADVGAASEVPDASEVLDACSSTLARVVTSLDLDAAADASEAGAPLVAAFKFGLNDLCLPSALPHHPDGTPTCHVILENIGPTCDAPGLSPASQADVDTLAAFERARGASAAPASPLCELVQLGPAAGCAASGTPAWYYALGACAGEKMSPACVASVCASDGFLEKYTAQPNWTWGARLVCP